MRLAMVVSIAVLLSCVAPAQDKALENRIDAYLAPFVAGKNFTGAVLIAKADTVLVSKGYGEANYALHVANTPAIRFHIASISKPFTAAALLLLEQQGKLSRQDKLSRYLPDFPHGDEITLLHLLTHTSGIVNINNLPEYQTAQRFPQTQESLIKLFKDKPLNFKPGERYEYSNSNYNLLAYVIEKASGKTFGEFLQESVFRPLGLSDTGHDGDAARIIGNSASGYQPQGMAELENAPYLDWSTKTGNGSLYSTTGDLLKFVLAYSRGRIVNSATVKTIWSEHRGNQFGWFVRSTNGELSIASNGRSPGFTSSLEYYPAQQITVIVLSNSYSPVSQSPIADDLAAMALGHDVSAQKTSPVKLMAAELSAIAGTYKFGSNFYRPNAEVVIRVQNGEAVLNWGGDTQSTLIPVGGKEFIDRQFWGRLNFEADGFRYSSSGSEFRAQRK